MENKRVVVAMSGGIDSSMTAKRMVDAGYDVRKLEQDAAARAQVRIGAGRDGRRSSTLPAFRRRA